LKLRRRKAMSQAQVGFLVLVFVATFALAIWVLGRTLGNASGQRLKRVMGGAQEGSGPDAQEWLERVARATKPLAKLSIPEAGYEFSAIRRRFMNAGVRSTFAPMAYFGVKTTLALLLPTLTFAALTLARSHVQGVGLLSVLLLVSTLGYYLPNYVLAKAIAVR